MKPVMLMILLTISIVTFFPWDRRNCLIISWLLPITSSIHLTGVNGRGRFLILWNLIHVPIPFLTSFGKKKHPYAIQNGSIKCKPRQLLRPFARVIKSAMLFGFLSFKRSWKENWAEQNILLRVLRFVVLSPSWLPSLTDASNGVTRDKQAEL